MKISKVNTSSFAIAEKFERNLIKFSSNDKRKIRLLKQYISLGKFRIIKRIDIEKGLLFKKNATRTKENHVYVDMNHADMYYVHNAGILARAPTIEKTDILGRLIDLPPPVIRTMGHLLMQGSSRYDALDQNAVSILRERGLVRVYETGGDKMLNLMKIATDMRETKVLYVKPLPHIPKFNDKKYDLSASLSVVDTIDDTYTKDRIKYSPEQVGNVIIHLFECNAILEEIAYLPHLLCEYTARVDHESVSHFPLCSKYGPRAKKNYETEVKLRPISLSTEMDVTDSVPIEKSTISFSDVGGLKDAKKEIMEAIVYPFTHPELSKKFGKRGGGGILLYGGPGCGKTQIARAAVTECGVSFFNVNISDILSNEGDEAEKLHGVFERASENAPAIIFFDEIDALCSRKDSTEGSRKKLLNQFLMDMSGVERLSEDVLVIAATDTPWDLDPALRRSGRFSKQIFIPPPDLDSRIDILVICTRDMPVSDDVDFRGLAGLTDGYSAADIDEVCGNAANIPWTKALSGKSIEHIKMDDFIKAIGDKKSTLIPWLMRAEDLILESGEKEVYRDLFDCVVELNRKFKQKQDDEGVWASRDKKSNEDERAGGEREVSMDELKKHNIGKYKGEVNRETERGEGNEERLEHLKRTMLDERTKFTPDERTTSTPDERTKFTCEGMKPQGEMGDEAAMKLRRERNDITHKIELIKTRYLQGEMEEQIYMDITKEYQKELIDIDLKLGKLNNEF